MSNENNLSTQASNIVSVSWGDHLVFGQGDGRLATPKAVRQCMKRWHEELGAGSIYWRIPHAHLPGRYYRARGYPQTIEKRSSVDGDFLRKVPEMAHEMHMTAYVYLSIFDDGWPLPPHHVRQVSYHNAMHGQHISWQSNFSRLHPEYTLVDRNGNRQWGVPCLAYPEVRTHFLERFLQFLGQANWDGLFICLRSQSHPADFADQFGFNHPIREEYLKRYKIDICTQDFDLQRWRDLLGEYLTLFIQEVRRATSKHGLRLAIGAPRGDVLGPPLGNTTLEWRLWVQERWIDELIINQNSSRCPSMWHDLWPMHRGYGYLQNYLDGYNLPSLEEHLSTTYAPFFPPNGQVSLYIARQWDERSETEERGLLAHPAVHGLVFSSFRFSNPEAVSRGNWVA
ncbi:MAG: hypothetical protein AB1345_01245 [Chloroflexota bacterium]